MKAFSPGWSWLLRRAASLAPAGIWLASLALATVGGGAGQAWAQTAGFEPGQVVRMECAANPFNPSQLSQVKVYSSNSAYSSVVFEGCGGMLRVLEVSGPWVKCQDQQGKFTGYVSSQSLKLVQDKPKSASAAPAPVAAPAAAPAPAAAAPAQPAPAAGGAPSSWSASAPPTPVPAAPAPSPPPASPPPSAGEQPLGWGSAPPAHQPGQPQLSDTGEAPPAKAARPRPGGEARQRQGSGQPSRCASLYLKMSMGKVLSREESDFLRINCN